MVLPPLTEPPTVEGFTVTVVDVELSRAQAPLCTIALNSFVVFNAPYV